MPQPLTKATLRGHFIALRQTFEDDAAQASAAQFALHIQKLIPSGAIVAGYRATSGEIDVTPAMVQLAARGCRLCLPVTQASDKSLIFRAWKPGERLLRGRYNIEIPEESADILHPDVIIVPLVAFDAYGYRLGYGGGYYDRTIAALRESPDRVVKLIGAGFGAQGIEKLPAELHDEKLNAVVTEKGCIEFA